MEVRLKMESALKEYLDRLKGKRVAVIGLGVSNTPLVERLLDAGGGTLIRQGHRDKNASISEVSLAPASTARATWGTSGRRPGVRKITDEIRPDDMVVLELSSFQLLTMRQSPSIAVVTNLAPNHLDVHRDMEEYVAAKRNVLSAPSRWSR